MARPFWQDENATSYAALVASLNGRFRGLSSRGKNVFDSRGDFDLSRNSTAKTLIVITVATIVLGAWAHWSEFMTTLEVLKSYLWGRVYTGIAVGLMAVNISAFLWYFLLVIRYRPAKSCTDEQLPTCTVIVPAYNEGRQVLRTLRSIARSDYPIDKLQIIAIDDGSRDNTWYWIEKAARELPDRIEAIRMPQNVGKRAALCEGFNKARGQILVTIDSDCLIEPQTLRRLVSPFYFDQRIGAVAGNVRVLNRHEGVIPRMLEVSFAYSFEFVRAAQSMLGAVLCTPGALAAYRRTPLMQVLDSWRNQTFFGLPSTIGEDRALTNWILRTGSLVTFQCNAAVYTNVPTAYKGLCKMLLRWGRSGVRETIVMAKFIFSKFRTGPATGARMNFLLACVNLFIPQITLAGMAVCMLWRPEIFLRQLMLGAVLAACAPAAWYALRRRSSNALWAFAQNIFAVAALSWIVPYSIFTCSKNSWLTREKGASELTAQQAAGIPQATRSAA
jgi:hyaluronan synthase